MQVKLCPYTSSDFQQNVISFWVFFPRLCFILESVVNVRFVLLLYLLKSCEFDSKNPFWKLLHALLFFLRSESLLSCIVELFLNLLS